MMAAERGAGTPVLLIVMGTSGCGKSTFGSMLAQSYSIPFVDGDDLHPASNVEKMSRGEALDDDDRLPWLQMIRHKALQLTHPVHVHTMDATETSPHDRPGKEQNRVRELAEVLETSQQGASSPKPEDGIAGGSVSAAGSKTTEEADQEGGTSIGSSNVARRACVIACSALKRSYRDILRGAESDRPLQVIFLYLKIDPAELKRRMHERKGHFMKLSMLQSQLATLEDPTGEAGAIVIEDAAPQVQISQAREGIKALM